jgi:DNA topoisomerase-1
VAVSLLEGIHVRIGNETYAKSNGSVGLSTLQKRHVKVRGAVVHFEFVGKSGRACCLDYRSPRVARTIRKCIELPGKRLFHYRTEEGTLEALDSADINAFLHEHLGGEFTAKDFRTWSGSVLATRTLLAADRPSSAAARVRILNACIREVADCLCNTPAVCRKYYIHPFLLTEFMERDLTALIARRRDHRNWRGLRKDERDLLKILYAWEETGR